MTLRSVIVNQFKQPAGFLGNIAGFIMAKRPSNRKRNSWTIDLLELESHHKVLEIGCGPGLALEECAELIKTGQVIGIDHSEVMIRQAQNRLYSQILKSNVAVRLTDLDEFTKELTGFDRVFSLNVVQFFPNINDAFQKIYACLNENGMSATTFQPRTKNPTRDQALSMALKVQTAMNEAGFTDIRSHELPLKPAPAICITGFKSRKTVGS